MNDPWVIGQLDLTIRLIIALVLGGLIGFEREISNQAAGFRTHILVCVGSALIMLLSIYGFSAFVNEANVRMDPSRLAAQVVSGIGFLGAGTIIRNGFSVSGLTTAASLWVVAAIGLAVGAGFYYAATLSCFMVIISLWILNKVEHKYFGARKRHTIRVHAQDQPGNLGSISTILDKRKIEIRKMGIDEDEEDERKTVYIYLNVIIPKASIVPSLLEDIQQVEGVIGVTME
ncbi:MgtC/SapB family protein [Paenibacillus lutrae]|uniref:ACT domain-containing protein n=1 Tax=Paenibacillus lutrae TaxID=2078573 RepID=A0A7X3K1D8_9BACL|nr:MgtC/SapB family protein [Paenibacillus lutrae]MVP02005.1 ACT domain-containing protein [Paenibacillus lutrae]